MVLLGCSTSSSRNPAFQGKKSGISAERAPWSFGVLRGSGKN